MCDLTLPRTAHGRPCFYPTGQEMHMEHTTPKRSFMREAHDEMSSRKLSGKYPHSVVWGKDEGGWRGYVGGHSVRTGGPLEVKIAGRWHAGRLESTWIEGEPWPVIYIGAQAIGIPHKDLVVRRRH